MTNYFDLFNLPAEYRIDLEVLKNSYQTLQKLTHPDRVASASTQEKRLFMQKNAQINDAYYVLNSPVKRGEHILELRGFELADEQATMGDTEFLMEQMSLREELMEAASPHQINNFSDLLKDKIQSVEEQIEQALNEETDEQNELAAMALTKLKFFLKLKVETQEKLQNVA